MESPITIRRAVSHDASFIADLYLTSRKTYLPFAPLAHDDDSVRGWIANVVVPKMHTTVAEVDGKIAGFCSTFERDYDWIDNLYVAPEQMRVGVGTHLLNEAVERLGRPIRLFTFQENSMARRFYEKHGFVAIQFGDGSDNEEGAPDVLYELRN